MKAFIIQPKQTKTSFALLFVLIFSLSSFNSMKVQFRKSAESVESTRPSFIDGPKNFWKPARNGWEKLQSA